MAQIFESAKTPLASALEAGVNTISLNQVLTFELYERKVSPIDGMVYWVNAQLLSNLGGTLNTEEYNVSPYNQGTPEQPNVPFTLQVKGSLHYTAQLNQSEDRSTAVANVIFTSLAFVQSFTVTNPQQMYICSYETEGGVLKFGFSEKIPFYQQAGLWHYRGTTLYSAMNTQIIEKIEDLDLATQTVSNSLPIWLSLDVPFNIYPSYLVPQNLSPPFIAIHIEGSQTTALAQTTFLNSKLSSYQLSKDTVRVHFYGLSNNQAIDFMNYVFQYTLDTELLGLMNLPIIQDQKVTQPEYNFIAKKKEAIFEVNYYQSRVQDVTRQLIIEAFCSVNINELPN
jgi:hypothetical protein